ncbi:MAG: CfrBI family restriction endonuclease [Firmicutes bacterium]|nr:CfrBI family restriction endonuclease [Bacillota bacterium]
MTFENEIIEKTVEKLIKGLDYREEVIRSINAVFLDFTVEFFKKIVSAKINSEDINLDWYKKYFITSNNFSADEAAIYAGINKKTITNIYGTANKDVVLNVANENFEYLSAIIGELENDANSGLAISIKISYNNITVDLSLSESLLVINALATKKIQIRGGAWSSIGKKVEKPLIDKLCSVVGVPSENIDNKIFKKDKSKNFDREVDYKLISRTGKVYRIEVKLMGKGNSESADATIARDTDIFVADTLSDQNRRQLESRGIKYLSLKGQTDSVDKFKRILNELDIPYAK